MNNKKVIVSKIESNEDAGVIIIDEKVSTPKASVSHVPAVNAIVASSLTQTNTNGPLSPKRTPINNNTCNIAEKRGKCLYLKKEKHLNIFQNECYIYWILSL